MAADLFINGFFTSSGTLTATETQSDIELVNGSIRANSANLDIFDKDNEVYVNLITGSDSTVYVKEADDFGTVVNGCYQLISGTTYILDALVLITDGFQLPDNGQVVIKSTNKWANNLVYSGSGTLFKATELGRLLVEDIFIFGGLFFFGGAQSTATCFDIASTQTRRSIQFFSSSLVDFDDMGTINDVLTLSFEIVDFFGYNTGLVFNDIGDLLIGAGRSEQFFTSATAAFEFTGACGLITIKDMIMVPGSTSFVFDLDTGFTVGSLVVAGNPWSSADGIDFFDSTGLNQSENTYDFKSNGDAPSSVTAGEIKMTMNTTITTIAAINTPVLVAGTTVNGFLERFSGTNQTLTYNAGRPIAVRVRAESRVEITGANEGDEIATYIYVDGVQQAITEDSQALGQAIGSPTSPIFSSSGFVTIEQDDTIQVFIENRTTTENLKVTHLDLTVEAIE